MSSTSVMVVSVELVLPGQGKLLGGIEFTFQLRLM